MMLDDVTHNVVFLWRSDQIDRGRTSPTRESNGQFAPGQNFARRSFGEACDSLSCFAASGLSLSQTGSASSCPSAHSRTEDCFYGQALAHDRAPGAPPGARGEAHDQRVGGSGFAPLIAAAWEKWLNARASQNCDVSFSTSLIVSLRRKWRRLIAGWLLNRRRNPSRVRSD
jgi:hypothetical protein